MKHSTAERNNDLDLNKSCIALIRTQNDDCCETLHLPRLSVCLSVVSLLLLHSAETESNMFVSRHAMSVWCFTPSSGLIKTETEKEMEDEARERKRERGMAPIMSRRPGGRGIGYRVILQGRWQKGWGKTGRILIEGLLMSVKQIEGNKCVSENMNINVARSRMSVYSRWGICSDMPSLKNENIITIVLLHIVYFFCETKYTIFWKRLVFKQYWTPLTVINWMKTIIQKNVINTGLDFFFIISFPKKWLFFPTRAATIISTKQSLNTQNKNRFSK